MHPGCLLSKLLQEQGGGDGAAFPSTHVFHISDVALDEILESVVGRHRPEAFSRLFSHLQYVVQEWTVVAEGPGIIRSQRNRAGSRQGGNIHQRAVALPTRISESIGEDQPAL